MSEAEMIDIKIDLEKIYNRLDAIERALIRLESRSKDTLHNSQILLGQYEDESLI
ncbi:MAG: hypothetical protein HQK62_07280 [Desulfamplus sp.]|nr:hypothetical protein [Desulfamplus sp.]